MGVPNANGRTEIVAVLPRSESPRNPPTFFPFSLTRFCQGGPPADKCLLAKDLGKSEKILDKGVGRCYNMYNEIRPNRIGW